MVILLQSINLALRFLLELCALTAVCFWGFHTGRGLSVKMLLGIGAPLLLAVIWGTFGSPKAAVQLSAPLHFLLELVVFGAAAAALYFTGKHQLAWVYGLIIVVNRILMVIWKQ